MQPGPSSSVSHLAGIVGPEAERISPCMTIGVGGEAIAARFEDGVDLPSPDFLPEGHSFGANHKKCLCYNIIYKLY